MNQKKKRYLRLIPLLALGLAGCGVQRTLSIKSDPPGALVYLNDQEVGRTPMTRPFKWYGTYDLQLRREGYQTLSAKPRVWAPWWQIVPIDLLAELVPLPLTDRHELEYRMKPLPEEPPEAEELVQRGTQLRGKLGTSATQPQ